MRRILSLVHQTSRAAVLALSFTAGTLWEMRNQAWEMRNQAAPFTGLLAVNGLSRNRMAVVTLNGGINQRKNGLNQSPYTNPPDGIFG